MRAVGTIIVTDLTQKIVPVRYLSNTRFFLVHVRSFAFLVLWPTWVCLISGFVQKINFIPWITIVHKITKTLQKQINCTVL